MIRLQTWQKLTLGGILFIIIINYATHLPVYYESIPHIHFPAHPRRCRHLNRNETLDQFNELQTPQDDPDLVRIIRQQFICQPPQTPSNLPPFDPTSYYFDIPSQIVSRVADILASLTPGFYIECGALDGIMASNTIWLERDLGWTGLLIEANQKDFKAMVSLNRQAWLSNFCLSTVPYPTKVDFHVAPKGGLPGVAGLDARWSVNTIPIKTQCMPLYTLLLALNQTVVDYFSLDIEGAELKILETIPFDKVIFKVLSIENGNPGGAPALKNFLERKGYIFYKFAPSDAKAWDSIFLHSSLKNMIED